MARLDAGGNRRKRFDIKCHFIGNTVEHNWMSVTHCPTSKMVADVLAKRLSKTFFESFSALLGPDESRSVSVRGSDENNDTFPSFC